MGQKCDLAKDQKFALRMRQVKVVMVDKVGKEDVLQFIIPIRRLSVLAQQQQPCRPQAHVGRGAAWPGRNVPNRFFQCNLAEDARTACVYLGTVLFVRRVLLSQLLDELCGQ